MAELRDNELNEVNGGKAQMDAWDLVFKSNNLEEDKNHILACSDTGEG